MSANPQPGATPDDNAQDIDPSKIEWTERELALIAGKDPDAAPVADELDDDGVDPDAPEPGETAETPEQEVAEETPDEPAAPQSWVESADVERAAKFGLSEYDLANEFGSRDEFRKALRLAELAAAQAARPESPKADDKPAETEAEYVDAAKLPDGRINPDYFRKHDYDEATVASMEALRATQDENLALKQSLQEREQYESKLSFQQQINEFHRVLDAHRPDFYGKAFDDKGGVGKFSPDEAKHRARVYEEAELIIESLHRRQERAGLPISTPPWNEVIRRAEQYAYGDELAARDGRKRVEAVKQQSNRRRPAAGSAGAAQSRRANPPADGDYSNDPDIIEAWKRATGELAGV